MATPVIGAGATPPEVPEQGHAEGGGVLAGSEVVGVAGPEAPSDYGWFRWIKMDQIPEYEAAGWKLSACVSRFHFDSYLMFKPAREA